MLAVRQNIESQLYVSKQSDRPRIKTQLFTNSIQIALLGLAAWPSPNQKGQMGGWRDGETKRNEERNRWEAWVRQFKVRPGAETRHQICKVPLRKMAFKEHIARKCLTNNNLILLKGFCHLLGEENNLFRDKTRNED